MTDQPPLWSTILTYQTREPMNAKIYIASMTIGFTLSTLAIVFGAMSLDFQEPSAATPVAQITCQGG
ncbi:hypothetical protein S420910_114 [Synechococcus phage S-CAM7]|uniref:Uncharacterized protein n=1 Tax=Synechococcus phage S-CAM7 TaxID=1883368 RepID=A0A1D8KUI4_9CAUD|nr:hypothetical protein S420910_114 [Synechococcus phage S-CAM7]